MCVPGRQRSKSAHSARSCQLWSKGPKARAANFAWALTGQAYIHAIRQRQLITDTETDCWYAFLVNSTTYEQPRTSADTAVDSARSRSILSFHRADLLIA